MQGLRTYDYADCNRSTRNFLLQKMSKKAERIRSTTPSPELSTLHIEQGVFHYFYNYSS